MEYQRLCPVDGRGHPINKGEWIPYGSDPFKYIKSVDHTYYLSNFIYNDIQKEQYKQTNSIAGMNDVTTDKLYFDFDCKEDLSKAKEDTTEMCSRLISHGISEDSILVCFSGAKGFSVEVGIDKRLKPEEIKMIACKMAEGLTTFDSSIYDSARIFRVPNTRHQVSGLYKTPMYVKDLSLSIDDIKKEASVKPVGSAVKVPQVSLPDGILELKRTDTKDRATHATIVDAVDLDFKHKAKGFSNCKYAMLNGFFPAGKRHDAIMILASTCRANGFPKEIAYTMCKGAARLQAQRYDSEPFPKEEIWRQVDGIYGERWKGGQYTCKSEGLLKNICESLGHNKCKHNEDVVVEPDAVFDLFKNYALNYDKNVLTTGIAPLDNKIKFLMGTSNGILAAPGVGKTSLSLSMLNHNSKQGVNCLFYSFDMFHSMLYLRMVQKHLGLSQDAIFKIIKDDPKKTEEIRNLLKKEYANVNFCFKTGQTPEEINDTIVAAEEKTGSKIKLVVIDYNELVIAEASDPTQASAQVAQKLRQIANERECAVITLLQPSKLYSKPSEEIDSYQGAKGSSAIAQSLTSMLSLSRPGFNPRKPEDDKFFSINCLKNRNGPLFSIDLGWEGLRGDLFELGYEEQAELNGIRERREAEKSDSY
jgi:KaiC/GvpD/RAD55 family RecA-like ATPase